MKIAYSKTREKYPLQPKKIIKKTITGSLRVLVFLAFAPWLLKILTIPLTKDSVGWYLTPPTWLTFFVVLVVAEYFYQRWYYIVYFYELTLS